MDTSLKKNILLSAICFLIIFFFYIIEIGNIDGIRQGTEGFYLQISKEMFQAKSWITPLYLGNNHWSKPPLHFWLSFPYYFLFSKSSLLLARLSTLTVSLFGVFYISYWIRKYFSLSMTYSACFFFSTLGIIKYSRIYMMEMPLAIFTTCAILLFFDHLQSNKNRGLLLSSFILGLSVLIKGPVSLVMAGGGSILYFFFNRKDPKQSLLPYIKLFSLALLFSSLWFFLAYIEHGYEFLNYFFLRENLGKFTAKSYPVRVVFQGLVIYGLPWSLFAPTIYFDMRSKGRTYYQSRIGQAHLFILAYFIIFFSLWLIPSQRSHHYAIPSLLLFLSLILISSFSKEGKKESRFTILINRFVAFFFTILIILIFPLFSFKDIFSNFYALSIIIFTIMALLFSIYCYLKNPRNIFKFLSTLITLGSIWSLLIPLFYLPLTPNKVINKIGTMPISVSVRKPYFIEEAIGRKVDVINQGQISEKLQDKNRFIITSKNLLDKMRLTKSVKIIETWPVWKRGRKFHHIWEALKRKELAVLQEEMILFQAP